MEFEDVSNLELNEKFTLMKWGNAVVKSIKKQENGSLFLEVFFLVKTG